MLYIPLLDLQNALGKSGASAISPAMKMIGGMLEAHPEETISMFMHCLLIIADLRVQPSVEYNTSSRTIQPPEIIACFLSEVFVWTIVRCANLSKIESLRARLEGFGVCEGFFSAVKEALAGGPDQQGNSRKNTSETNHVLFAAADVISKMTPWNASLNLALLLCHRGRASTARDDLEIRN
jgi:hypothetical protein